jgi:hypothetical protein
MRARHRHLIAALIAAIAVALTPASVNPSGATASEAACPQGTSWDNFLQRCV